MRLCNGILLDEKGERRVVDGETLECQDVSCLRFEPAFLFATETVTVRWSDEAGHTLLCDTITVDRESVAVFIPVPSYVKSPTLHCAIWHGNQRLKNFRLRTLACNSSRLAIDAFVRETRRQYYRVYDWIKGLPFEEMLRYTHAILSQSGAQLILITGSVGKTSTKELTAHLLRQENLYHSTDSWNFPHEICAQIILNVSWANVFVMEIAVGDHLPLVGRLLPPAVLVFTHLGPVHTAQYPNILDIGALKASLASHMDVNSTVIFNADVPQIHQSLEKVLDFRVDQPKKILFSTLGLAEADVMAERDPVSRDIKIYDRRIHRKFPLSGNYAFTTHPSNVAAAYCVCTSLKSNFEDITEAMCTFASVPSRLQTEIFGSKMLIDDAYNANPVSMKEFLGTLRYYRSLGRRVCVVIGEMADLGAQTLQHHRLIVDLARDNFDLLVLIGPTYKRIGYNNQEWCLYFESGSETTDLLAEILLNFDVVGVKGSYCTGLLHMAAAMRQRLAETEALDPPEISSLL